MEWFTIFTIDRQGVERAAHVRGNTPLGAIDFGVRHIPADELIINVEPGYHEIETIDRGTLDGLGYAAKPEV